MRAVGGRVHIGTSGWHYDHWRGSFYPPGLPASRFLEHYAAHFATAEINNSFYRLPEEETLARWRDRTPDGFVFAAKASRYLTHMKKLREPEEPLQRLFGRLETLGEKLGPVLFQLPPRWRANQKRLEGLLRALPPGRRCAFEFRDASWFNQKIYRLLREHGAALCVYDLAGQTSPPVLTAGFAYVRLHGPEGPYRGCYGERRLAGWAGLLRGWAGEGVEVYCYFDNDEAGYAPRDAGRLKKMMEV
ncbi:hypothetical protein RxyAA322_28770 [Rubrobacter xylanophilus]|uniref:DUF72 domain-containing protein n=1 Tax=Rubrobacter xylanophilus TaxID=49319 RepID=A0A510HPX0_9ACTN|nr:DUF72 domain-containing protein [Rubrobacter xylanophilus]BBL81023.1 hypothetical protein RxyAA322_28770 [Rubrobacter xylanophilus]